MHSYSRFEPGDCIAEDLIYNFHLEAQLSSRLLVGIAYILCIPCLESIEILETFPNYLA
jgi:hypothetical protein